MGFNILTSHKVYYVNFKKSKFYDLHNWEKLLLAIKI